MSKIKKINKLDINLLSNVNEENYRKERAKFIAGYEVYIAGGFLSSGYYEKNPVVGEAKWNEKYPEGYEDWASQDQTLTSAGQLLSILGITGTQAWVGVEMRKLLGVQ